MRAVYLDRTITLDGGLVLTFSEEALLRAAGKYARAITHVARLYRHLFAQTDDFELEISVD